MLKVRRWPVRKRKARGVGQDPPLAQEPADALITSTVEGPAGWFSCHTDASWRCTSCAKLADGSAAVVVGLTGAAEHNGKEAHVLGLHAESGRVEVALSAVKTLRLKRANLRA